MQTIYTRIENVSRTSTSDVSFVFSILTAVESMAILAASNRHIGCQATFHTVFQQPYDSWQRQMGNSLTEFKKMLVKLTRSVSVIAQNTSRPQNVNDVNQVLRRSWQSAVRHDRESFLTAVQRTVGLTSNFVCLFLGHSFDIEGDKNQFRFM